MLANLVNGLCALASGTPRKKEETLSGKLSEGRVSFEDALSHIYPEKSPRTPTGEQNLLGGVSEAPVVVQSVTIYDAYKAYEPKYRDETQPVGMESSVYCITPVEPVAVAETVDLSGSSAPSYASVAVPASSPEPAYAQTPVSAPAAYSAPASSAFSGPTIEEILSQGQRDYEESISSIDESQIVFYEDETKSQFDTYDNLPATPSQSSPQSIEELTKTLAIELPIQTQEYLAKTLQLPMQAPPPAYAQSYEQVTASAPAAKTIEKTIELPFEKPAQTARQTVKTIEKTVQLPVQTPQAIEKTVEMETLKTFENLSQLQADLAQQILGNYTETVSPVRRDFLDYTTNASNDFLAGNNKPAEPVYTPPSSMTTSMTALVDRIFNIIEPYVHELNQSFRTTELSVTFTPPAMVNEHVGVDTLRRPSITVSSYRCRISTSRLAMVVRGKEDRVEFFILPVEKVMGLSKSEDELQPLMTFNAHAQSGLIFWEVEEKPLTEERMERYILLAFEHLMDLTREELLKRPYAAIY